ncbi:hypothetical protein CRM22_000461, partial [Opisthorchis felineus]
RELSEYTYDFKMLYGDQSVINLIPAQLSQEYQNCSGPDIQKVIGLRSFVTRLTLFTVRIAEQQRRCAATGEKSNHRLILTRSPSRHRSTTIGAMLCHSYG